MIHEDLISKYNLDKAKLFKLYDDIVSFLKEKGISVYYENLHKVVEVDIYNVDSYHLKRTINEEDKHHESCLSDGMDVWLHDDMEEIGGITGRLYDILHVACGHAWQWGAPNEYKGLTFAGDKAWVIGSTYYGVKERAGELWVVEQYEKEAGMLALANLKLILKKYEFDDEFSTSFTQLFNDYLATDLEYIMSFYKNLTVENFFNKWKYKAEEFGEKNPNFELHLQSRTNKCIALLGVRT